MQPHYLHSLSIFIDFGQNFIRIILSSMTTLDLKDCTVQNRFTSGSATLRIHHTISPNKRQLNVTSQITKLNWNCLHYSKLPLSNLKNLSWNSATRCSLVLYRVLNEAGPAGPWVCSHFCIVSDSSVSEAGNEVPQIAEYWAEVCETWNRGKMWSDQRSLRMGLHLSAQRAHQKWSLRHVCLMQYLLWKAFRCYLWKSLIQSRLLSE